MLNDLLAAKRSRENIARMRELEKARLMDVEKRADINRQNSKRKKK